MKRIITTLAVLITGLSLYGQIPSWLVTYRDAVYGQNLSITEAERLFQEADRRAKENLTGSALYVMLSRCEYLLGRVYQDHGRNNEATAHYEKGISLAEQALAEGAGAAAVVRAEAHEMIASNVGQLCMIKSRAWVMANGLKVEDNAKKARQLNSRNAGALYLLASRWAFGPGVFGDPKRGITELEAILNGQADLQKDTYFNVYSALGYACLRLNRYEEALAWVQKSLALYPTNKFALDLQSQIQEKLRTAK
ncbi:MAG: tetratricopeptide repeat protein [Treponema sp.]|nr:tetratricopeptide repeat protein [Treponema sp.]